MRAAVVRNPGQAIQIIDTPTPSPGASEIRVRLLGAAVNPVDIQTARGTFHEIGWIDQPEHTGLGWDVAGEVTALGSDVHGLTVGTRVAALSAGVDKPLGPYAEEVIVPASAAAPLPAGLDPVDAATVPLNALTASQALDLLGDPAARTLLVTGAAGAVGGYAVRLGVARGWTVVGLGRPTDTATIEEAGAAPATSLDEVSPVDATFDPAALAEAALAVTRDGGHYVGVLPPRVPASERGIRTEAVDVHEDAAELARLLRLTATGELPARVHAVAPLDEVNEVHEKVAGGGVRGRYVIVP
ncbi:zinc-binding dehydrogenase [Luteipulveratus sp. YIM 133132]|uniref:alcohol dehydrogenase catalytic domain-containing protein n=1 Tax=Luteipulveratus flavus TaxID=3031728 RepID=UPI0023B1C434|nr:zinc-binding dehydrogenase [Luteipulveratus sp. YIM 133132]MDE9367180.1 zinc-binding dehydrogenase [Luteipulveratus sp. YIM 133132]